MSSQHNDPRVSMMITRIRPALEEFFEKDAAISDVLGCSEGDDMKTFENCASLVENVLRDQAEEREEEKQEILASVKATSKRVHTLCKELQCEDDESLIADKKILKLQEMLEAAEDRLTALKRSRLEELKTFVDEEKELLNTLGLPKRDIDMSQVPSDYQLTSIKENIRSLNQMWKKHTKRFKSLKSRLIGLMEDMGEEPSEALEYDVVNREESAFILSDKNLNDLERCVSEKEIVRKAKEEEIEELKRKILQVREKLPAEALKSNRRISWRRITGVTPHNFEILEEELQKMNFLKALHIKDFIEELRKEIQDLWDQCLHGDEERSTFPLMTSETYDDELLLAHEEKRDGLRRYLERNQSILKSFKKWLNLFNRKRELESNSQNSGRLNNRGGRLLKEEQERNRVDKQLPILENALKKSLEDYERDTGLQIKYFNAPMIQVMEETWDSFNNEKENLKLERKREKEITALKAHYASRNMKRTAGEPSCMYAMNKSPTKKLKTQPSFRHKSPFKGSRQNLATAPPCSAVGGAAVGSYEGFEGNLRRKGPNANSTACRDTTSAAASRTVTRRNSFGQRKPMTPSQAMKLRRRSKSFSNLNLAGTKMSSRQFLDHF